MIPNRRCEEPSHEAQPCRLDEHAGCAARLILTRRRSALRRRGDKWWLRMAGRSRASTVHLRKSTWRCCTALAESEIRLWWWPRYVSSMKYPKRCQYKHAKQKKYHVRNWAEYNEGLRRRGDLTVWFDEEAIANWKADKTGKPGGQRVYSDMAIETGLVCRVATLDGGSTSCCSNPSSWTERTGSQLRLISKKTSSRGKGTT